MKETLVQIETNINNLLDIYDSIVETTRNTETHMDKHEYIKKISNVTDCIEHELNKLAKFSSFEDEIKISTNN